VEPKSQIAVVDSNVTFSCNATGVPDAVITWSVKDGRLPQNIVTNYSLTLLTVKNTDKFEGIYTCNATNRAGHDAKTANLTVDGLYYLLKNSLIHNLN